MLFLAAHPELAVEAMLDDRHVDLGTVTRRNGDRAVAGARSLLLHSAVIQTRRG